MDNNVQEFNDIKSFMRFIMNYQGELKIRGTKAYFEDDLVAQFCLIKNKETI